MASCPDESCRGAKTLRKQKIFYLESRESALSSDKPITNGGTLVSRCNLAIGFTSLRVRELVSKFHGSPTRGGLFVALYFSPVALSHKNVRLSTRAERHRCPINLW